MACRRRALELIVCASLLISFEEAFSDRTVPQDLTAKVAALNESQRAFIESGAMLDFLPERQLIHEPTTLSTTITVTSSITWTRRRQRKKQQKSAEQH